MVDCCGSENASTRNKSFARGYACAVCQIDFWMQSCVGGASQSREHVIACPFFRAAALFPVVVLLRSSGGVAVAISDDDTMTVRMQIKEVQGFVVFTDTCTKSSLPIFIHSQS